MWNYEQPVKIIFGKGTVKQLTNAAALAGGSKGLLVCSPFFVRSHMAEKILAESNGAIVGVYGNVSPNPDVTEVDACAAMLRDLKADFVIALGGGSVMDCAKAAATICLTDDPISKYHGTGVPIPDAHLPLLAVPTTSGTGSEVTCVSVLTDHQCGKKAPIVSNGFYPVAAIVDPELTYTLPPQITASTGLDVLSHALEGYWSKGHQPICDACAIYAADLVFRYLYRAYLNPADEEAREKMAEASLIAGLAFTLPKTTSSHACSFPLTNLHGIPHGEACALTLDWFARINATAENGRVDHMAVKLGFRDTVEMADAIHNLKEKMGMRVDLKDMALMDAQIADLVKISRHPNLYNNPVEITDDMLLEMYESMR